ncbi:MAG: ChaN family lipoprotein [Oligoflexia bacterium]|nr:ChaN family lipoprotein [Oligoflexia bacterium]
MRLKSQIFQLHHITYKELKKRAQALCEEGTPELQEYIKNHKRLTKRQFTISSLKELFSSINQSSIIFVGDFHTFELNTKNYLRLARHFHEKKMRFALALEMVSASNQTSVDKYLQKKISELQFLQEIDYSRSWHFPWSHYKGIFELAKKSDIPIVALNSKGSIRNRDENAAEILAQYHLQNPDIKILILFGELHIFPNKLPRVLLKLLKSLKSLKLLTSIKKTTIIHQNLDEISDKLYSNNIKNAVIKFNFSGPDSGPEHEIETQEFSIQNSLPWTKYESMLYWFENYEEDPAFDIHQYIIEHGMKLFGDNAATKFLSICKQIIKSLRLEHLLVGDDNFLENFNIYDHSGRDYIENIICNLGNHRQKKLINHLFHAGHPFHISEKNIYYSAYYSINRLSYLVGLHLFVLFSKYLKINTDIFASNTSTVSIFFFFLQQETIAYFCSKLINPHRRCDRDKEIVYGRRDIQQDFSSQQSRRIAISNDLTLDKLDKILKNNENNNKNNNENKNDSNREKINICSVFDVAKVLGNVYGDMLFEQSSELEYQESVQLINNTLFSHQFTLSDLQLLHNLHNLHNFKRP